MSEHSCNCGGGDNSSCGGQSGCGGPGPSEADKKLAARLARIKNIIVVLSGKGGVGKSAVAANIAVGLALAGKQTGLLDVDVHGPSIPRVLGLTDAQPHVEQDFMEPVPWDKNLWVLSLGFLLPNVDQAVIWRGPVKIGVIRQFVQDVTWGDLDYLIVDCPPGTGDEPLSALQTLGPRAQALIVTTPQAVAVDDVRRSVNFCREVGNPILGLVENMSGYACSQCGHVENIFSQGGGEALAKDLNVTFLGAIPLDPAMVLAGDNGKPVIEDPHNGPAAEALGRIVKKVLMVEGALQEDTPGQVITPDLSPNGASLIAIPVADGKLCQHFGHCNKFALVDIDAQAKTVKGVRLVDPPPHEPGVLPAFLADQGVHMVIAGGMGARAQSLFTERGIRVVIGAQPDTPENVAQAYLDGRLTSGANICDH